MAQVDDLNEAFLRGLINNQPAADRGRYEFNLDALRNPPINYRLIPEALTREQIQELLELFRQRAADNPDDLMATLALLPQERVAELLRQMAIEYNNPELLNRIFQNGRLEADYLQHVRGGVYAAAIQQGDHVFQEIAQPIEPINRGQQFRRLYRGLGRAEREMLLGGLRAVLGEDVPLGNLTEITQAFLSLEEEQMRGLYQNLGEEAVAEDEEARFEQDRQNIHRTEVERSVDSSIALLLQTYPRDALPAPIATMTQIRAFIASEACQGEFEVDELAHIAKGLEFLSLDHVANATHVQSGLKMKQVLSLIWLAAGDETQLPDDFPAGNDKESFARMRKISLVEKILFIATTYRNPNGEFRAACIGGARNHLVSALNKAHPDVSIAHTATEVSEHVGAAMKRFLHNALMRRLDALKAQGESLAPIREILASWDVVDTEEAPSSATLFKRSVQEDTFAFLDANYSRLLSRQQMDVVKSNYEYLAKPNIDESLLVDVDHEAEEDLGSASSSVEQAKSRCAIM